MTYADECIERASKANPGPWHTSHINENYPDEADIGGPNGECIADNVSDFNRDFIIHAITDVEELAKKLKLACAAIREVAYSINSYSDPCSKKLLQFADELEAIPSDK